MKEINLLIDGLNNLKTNKMKQTAVEWYLENVKLTEIEYLDDKITTTQLDVIIDNLGEQAKEMEKQQIIDAWKDGAYGGGQFTTTFDTAEQYYNETFEK
jgi:hypothetical protein